MNKIGQWHNTNVMPLESRLVLVKYSEYNYMLARLTIFYDKDEDELPSLYFLGENDESCQLQDVVAWAYISLDDTKSIEMS